ncbi:MAG: riboflavin biosynthesis protein RibD [Candidatus Hydrogenedentes bacterium CG1_02_42_14]|nr:MAG: riboflavin biosynthesis protein RibD [Candidatus Hydrogenedentes bacterium CG1_02_42_14]
MMNFMIKRALELARRGQGYAHPNPLVGAVIVINEDIVGRGWHKKFGGAHAEIEAIRDAKKNGYDNLKNAELYVTLEPCSHFGKTPPCTSAIIAEKIPKVIYAIDDPNPLVAGKGKKILEEAGIEVVTGICRDEAIELNKSYLHFIETGLPYITWKIAMTIDGSATFEKGKRSEITGSESRDFTDRLRAKYDAVMIGAETAVIDNPGLRVRNKRGRDPKRIVIDSKLRTTLDSRLIAENSGQNTIIITSKNIDSLRLEEYRKKVEVIVVSDRGEHLDLNEAMRMMAEKGIIEILLESGGTLGKVMLSSNFISEILVFHAPIFLNSEAEKFNGKIAFCKKIGEDHLMRIKLK